jgi:hypothetical protein
LPKIPEYQQTHQMNVDRVPGADISPGAFGQTDDAFARLGGQLAQLGSNLLEKRDQAEANNYEHSMLNQRAIEYSDFKNKLKLTYGNEHPDYEDYATTVKQWMDERYQDDVKKAPSELAKQRYQQSVGNFFTNQLVQSQNEEYKFRAQHYVDQFGNDLDTAEQALEKNPDPALATTLRANLQKRIQDGLGTNFNPEQADTLKEATSRATSRGILRGIHAAASKPEDFQAGLAYLKAPDGSKQADLMDGLTADDRFTWTEKFQNGMKLYSHMQSQDENQRYSDLVGMLQTQGGEIDPRVPAALNRQRQAGDLSQQEWLIKTDTLNFAKQAGDFQQSLALVPDHQVGANLAQFKERALAATQALSSTDPSFNFNHRAQIIRGMDSIASNALSVRAQDRNAYVTAARPDIANAYKMALGSNDPATVQDSFQKVVSAQVATGATEPQATLLNTSTAKGFAQALDTSNEQAAAQWVTEYQRRLGPLFPKFMSELVDQGKLSKEYEVLGFVPDPLDKQTLIQSIKNGKNIDVAIEKLFPRDHVQTMKDLRLQVATELRPVANAWFQTALGGSRQDSINSLIDLTQKEAARIIVASDGKTDPDVAAKQASKTILGLGDVIHGPNSLVWAPKQVGGAPLDKTLIGNFMQTHMDESAFKSMGVATPGDMKSALTPAENETKFFDYLKTRGKWVTDPSMTGLYLAYPDQNGHYWFAHNEKGQIIGKKYLDITRNPDEKTQGQSIWKDAWTNPPLRLSP